MYCRLIMAHRFLVLVLVLVLALGLAAPVLAAPGRGLHRRGTHKPRSLQKRPLRRVDAAAYCDAAIARIARRTARGKRLGAREN